MYFLCACELYFCHRYSFIDSVALFKAGGGRRCGEGMEYFHCAGQGKKGKKAADINPELRRMPLPGRDGL